MGKVNTNMIQDVRQAKEVYAKILISDIPMNTCVGYGAGYDVAIATLAAGAAVAGRLDDITSRLDKIIELLEKDERGHDDGADPTSQ